MDRTKYLEVLTTIFDNSLYTAETHFVIANDEKKKSFWFKTVPAALAAFLSVLAANNVAPEVLIWLSAISAVISVVSNIVDPMNLYYSHLNAARTFIVVKHDARSLRDVFHNGMADENFILSVKNLHERYNDLVRLMPETNDKAFSKASKRIDSGVHEKSNEK